MNTIVSSEDWSRSSVFNTYITHEKNKYKLMIHGDSCVNIITKTALKNMSLKIEPHPHSYKVYWVYKTTQSITQYCQVPIHMSSYEDRV